MRSQRIQQIEEYITANKTVALDDICRSFDISKSTLRRDLGRILQNKDIKKIYGGVAYQPQKKLVPFEERNIANAASKQEIARRAVALAEPGDVIFIDSGTTTLYMADGLREKGEITVLTNNIEFILRSLPYENIHVISLSGMLNRRTVSFTGPTAAEILERYNIGKAFMATTGFSAEHGVTNSSPEETQVKRVAVARSQKVILLADSTKFNAVSLVTYCGLDRIDTLISDCLPPQSLTRVLEQNNIQVIA